MTKVTKRREVCDSEQTRGNLTYPCGRTKGHAGSHRFTRTWTKGNKGNRT